jgi:Ni2+-binding GTPase involved in maturation of urease and hydrogenase
MSMNQKKSRYVMIGGFLGAGKTTSILKFVNWLSAAGLRVGLITNDQGGGLVDTSLARSHKIPVEEITGGCFCCRFASLVEAADSLIDASAPDVLIAEPVGSCTDLVATVSLPLEQIYGDRFTIAPVSVVLDPLRAERIFGLTEGSRLSENVAYIYRKQIEEAELIVINKIDLLDASRVERLRDALQELFPKAHVHACCARTETGMEPWFSAVMNKVSNASAIAGIDYDRYAIGESLLGWLNAEIRLGSDSGAEFDGNRLLIELLNDLRLRLSETGHEIAHLKATLSIEGDPYELAAANLVCTDESPILSHTLADPVDVARLLLNLRAEAPPERLKAALGDALAERCQEVGFEILHMEHFRPGRPVPTHRLAMQR